MCQVFLGHIAQIMGIPQGNLFFYCSCKGGSFSQIAIERFTLVFDSPAWLILFCPETEIHGIEYHNPVDGSFGMIVEVVLLVPDRGSVCEGIAFMLHPLAGEKTDAVDIDPDLFALFYNLASATQNTKLIALFESIGLFFIAIGSL